MSNRAVSAFFDRMSELGVMLTYDDVRLHTRHSEVLPSGANVNARFSRKIKLRIPIASSPMDTVTKARMAIAMAEAGGIGIIHRGLSPEAQAKEVGRVKHRLHGRIGTPITVLSTDTIAAVLSVREKEQFSFHTFPVIDEAGKMVGLLTGNDFDFCTDSSLLVSKVMTPIGDLICSGPKCTQREAHKLLLESKRKVLPLIGDDGRLEGVFLFSDLKRILTESSDHNVDQHGQLVVGAAVGAGEDALVRAELLKRKGCDLFVIDTAHGDSRSVIEMLQKLKNAYPDVDVVAGNVSNGTSARRLADAGADGVLVGQGPGSICTTRVIAGIGVPQVSAVYDCVKALANLDVPVCADGGISNSGDMVIALAIGASSVMLGRLLAGTREAPGETRIINGVQVKDYRGMGSFGAMRASEASRDRYGQGGLDSSKLVPEGVEGIVSYQGPVQAVLDQHVGGVKSGMGYNGAKTLKELREHAEIFRISPAGFAESHPHDVAITAAAPNYRGR